MVLKVLWIKILFIKLTNCSKHSLILAKIGIKVHLMHEFLPLEPFPVFLQQTCPIHYFWSKTHVLDGFVPFWCHTRPAVKISNGVHLKHEFVPRKPFLVRSQRTFSIHNFRSKTHVYKLWLIPPCTFIQLLMTVNVGN